MGLNNKQNQQLGFTLIEMVVSLALFTTVIGISVGALIILIGSNQQLQNEQSVMTNLSFALDSMTREIRTGIHYYCDSAPNILGNNNIFNPANDLDSILELDVNDCPNGRNGNNKLHGVAFSEGGDSITGSDANRILYYHDHDEGKIYRRVGSGPAQSIVSSGIFITDAEFYVTGSKPLSAVGANTDDQAMVTIFIEARDINDPTAKAYKIQTTVTQRTLDI